MISTILTPDERAVFDRFSGISIPRHVAYPMPTWWTDMGEAAAEDLHARARERAIQPDLSLYVHIPFCEALCKFCACSRVIVRKTQPGGAERVASYVDALEAEIRALGARYADRPLRQVHWGGGTPTYLAEEDIARIADATRDTFAIADDAEISIEVDPRVTTRRQLELLRAHGFNRISLGVQDFDPRVQSHVKRIQPFEMVERTVDACREAGFGSVNFDLIYGLPYQTMATIEDTLEKVVRLGPDRIAYYHYAQIPDKIATQVAIHHHMMPDSAIKLEMFLYGVERLAAAGYDFVGLDHFARSDEMLVEAAQEGTLQRNFQGMTTGGGLDLLGAGASSISHLHRIGFLQSERQPDAYTEAMASGASIVRRGLRFSEEDCVRQAIIGQIYCGARIVPGVIEAEFGIDFESRFARELETLRGLEEDGLVAFDREGIDVVFPLGRVLLRNVAAVFDGYLAPDAYRVGDQAYFSVNA